MKRKPGKLTRRDFLKLAGALPAAGLAAGLPLEAQDIRGEHISLLNGQHNFNYLHANLAQTGTPNIIVLIYDAFSAQHLSLGGYPRSTTPNIDRFARRATVYHNHHSAGNFTTPSTASLFTGVYPWKHRAFSLGGLIQPQIVGNNLFKELGNAYHRLAFTQNIYVDQLLYQLEAEIDQHPRLDSFSAAGHTFYNRLFKKDAILGLKSYDEFLFIREQAHGSLFLSLLNDLQSLLGAGLARRQLKAMYPEQLPRLANTDVYYRIDQTTDGVMQLIQQAWQASSGGLPTQTQPSAQPPTQPGQPFFAYLHLMPPHAPYLPSSKFSGMFGDGWAPLPQKQHRLGADIPQERLNEQRQAYDEFIADLDEGFGRLLDDWEERGILDNSYVILTSDHGEMFAKGVSGHSTPLVFEPGIRVPLIISAPGQRERKDVYALTSTVDLLPSILKIAEKPAPGWCEGQLLPSLGGKEDPQRSIFVVEAKKNPAYQPLAKATAAVLRWPYKLVLYRGYKNFDGKYELYHLENDPYENVNVYKDDPAGRELQQELDARLAEADSLFR